jgi:two-component system cell cycle sensor histidine kinase/response regulator CckA
MSPIGAARVTPGEKHRLDEADARERAARDTLSAVAEHTDTAIVGVTLDGVVTAWNGGAEHLFGYHADEVAGRQVAMFADAGGAEEQQAILERIRRGERGVFYETQRVHKDGSPLEVSLNVAPIKDSAGRVTGVSVAEPAVVVLDRDTPFLEKPFTADELLRKVHEAVKDHAVRPR